MHFININMQDIDKNRNTTLNYKKKRDWKPYAKIHAEKPMLHSKHGFIHYLLNFHKIKSSDF